jgi:hypothetical protein
MKQAIYVGVDVSEAIGRAAAGRRACARYARRGERYQIDLRSGGVENLTLDVTIVIA